MASPQRRLHSRYRLPTGNKSATRSSSAARCRPGDDDHGVPAEIPDVEPKSPFRVTPAASAASDGSIHPAARKSPPALARHVQAPDRARVRGLALAIEGRYRLCLPPALARTGKGGHDPVQGAQFLLGERRSTHRCRRSVDLVARDWPVIWHRPHRPARRMAAPQQDRGSPRSSGEAPSVTFDGPKAQFGGDEPRRQPRLSLSSVGDKVLERIEIDCTGNNAVADDETRRAANIKSLSESQIGL